MTLLLTSVIAFFIAMAIYMASLVVKYFKQPADFLDGDRDLPGWVFLFAATGVTVSAHGLYHHFILLAKYGFQFNHVGMGLVIIAMISILFMQRLWLASRLSGLRTPGDVFAGYYGSHTIRLYLLFLLVLFAIPFAAMALSYLGVLLDVTSGGAINRDVAIWIMGFFLFLYSCVGGWRAVAFVVTAQTITLMALLALLGVYAFVDLGSSRAVMDAVSAAQASAAVSDTIFNSIPGVIQFTKGLGKEVSAGGIWTTAAIFSYGLALTGTVLSPAVCFLAITCRSPRGFAFQQVWMTGGLAAALLLVLVPLIGLLMVAAGGSSAPTTGVHGLYAATAGNIADSDLLMAVAFVFMLLLSLQISVCFFATAGANVFSLEVVKRYINPDASEEALKLGARIALAVIFLLMALLASFSPAFVFHMFGGLALSLAAQLIPAFIGLCWAPWISSQGVIVGLIVGMILVVFTEPLGILAFEQAFVDLPWGRWPWTIHSAGWGLVFNLLSCLLISGFTRRRGNREHRDGLHRAFARDHGVLQGRPRTRTAIWSLTLIWTFFAVGPGAILGNTIFSLPVMAEQVANIDMPSIWVWQIVFWLIGVTILWWMAYRAEFSVLSANPEGRVELISEASAVARARIPNWIRLFLARFASRDGRL